MSYIQFESAREKEKIRQELREAREQMLEKAKKNAELRAAREVQKDLSGENNWMLPQLAKKFDNKSKNTKKIDKKSKKKKKKKSKSKHKKRRHKSSTSGTSEDSDTDSSSSEDEKSHKKSKRTKRKRKQSSSSGDSEESSDNDSRKGQRKAKLPSSDANTDRNEWVERPSASTTTIQRDSWMTGDENGAAGSLMLKTFTRDRQEKKTNEKQEYNSYDPTKSTRELNPYWKMTGTGLPAFQKPKDDSDEEKNTREWKHTNRSNYGNVETKGWRKPVERKSPQHKIQHQTSSSSASNTEKSDESDAEDQKKKTTAEASSFLTDQQMNELGAKIVKAEIMGNEVLANELKLKLENARTNRVAFKEQRQHQQSNQTKTKSQTKKTKEEHILLTTTDERGNTRPLMQAKSEHKKQSTFVDPRDLYGGRQGGRKKKEGKRMETHMDGERVRYFADDDKYDIKQMFEREKYSTAADSNLQFANIASKNKNPNDDLEDIFADKVRRNISKEDSDQKEYQRAVNEHQKLAKQLDHCDKCFDSEKMNKKLLVSMGEKVYLTLPWHIGLQPGHCLIVPTQHVSCCTQLDEDTWEEISNFRKALTRMFAAQHKDVIFFEIANKLHRRPHLSIHCIPIPDTQGEMAPFYFKKAIEESEHEWSVNKQLVSLRQKGLRSCVPRGLPYFWVNFGMDSGFAHVIEDQERFPQNFALEIIGGMLHLDANKWRRPQVEQNIIAKVKMFADWWKKYDCTA